MENERKLAHIERITDLQPIEGADKIEKAIILGWECVVKKGEFKIGERVIYCEVDSVMPEKPEFEFLRDRKFRIRTIKLRGQISQGLVLPLSIIWNYNELPHNWINKPNGTDVTELLGITKYLTPSEREEISPTERKLASERKKLEKFMLRYSWFRRFFISKKVANRFPYWVTKTDEERVQNLNWGIFYEQFKDREIYVTEKIDYQSVTFTGKMLPNPTPVIGKFLPKIFKFIVCSRNLVNTDKNSLYHRIAKKYDIENILKKNPTLTIQGEQGDTKIQGNKYGIIEPTMWVFNIIDHEKNYHFDYFEMLDFCEKYNLNIVPSVFGLRKGFKTLPTLQDIGSTVQELVEFSKGKSVITPEVHREGIVIRCVEKGRKVFSFKVINPDFLLKYEN